MEPQGNEAEGWQTGVAIDASASMQGPFGRLLLTGPRGAVPPPLLAEYQRKGWVKSIKQDGIDYQTYAGEAVTDAMEKGHFVWSGKEVEPVAREMTAYLASNLDADGGTTVIYWACGDGSQIEELGDLTSEDCKEASFQGPVQHTFGNKTILTPAVRYFAERFRDARRGMYIFITDGELNDLEEVKRYTIGLCKDIESGRRNPLKCVLIGVGSDINETQMEELDDLESGTEVDIWDHKIHKEMRGLTEIFAEVVSENQIIAPTARIFDATGQMVRNFADGLPAKVTFTMPASSAWFELEVAGRRIRQSIVETNP
ncbi:MAG: vWA domain-containing protein [Candidatus Competibacteraceae bacterium]